ncbi:hypothetical protein OROHE_011676 [Orobanche hederae]
MKLELILRLLDNDELSREQVNDVKDFLDDYVERNQEDFWTDLDLTDPAPATFGQKLAKGRVDYRARG